MREMRLRTLIDKAVMGKGTSTPQLLGTGRIWYVPSVSDPGAYYIVGEILHVGTKKLSRELVCECTGFRMSARGVDQCQHVKSTDRRIGEATKS